MLNIINLKAFIQNAKENKICNYCYRIKIYKILSKEYFKLKIIQKH